MEIKPGDAVVVKGKKVLHTVLIIGPLSTQVQDDRENEFWVPNGRIQLSVSKESFLNGPPVAIEEPPAPPTYAPVPATDESIIDYKQFVASLSCNGYRLYVACREDGVDKARSEYLEWSGEELDDSHVKHYENKPISREWFLCFQLDESVVYPFPLLARGTGRISGNKAPCGYYREHNVEVCYAALVEEAVRAGLRAQI